LDDEPPPLCENCGRWVTRLETCEKCGDQLDEARSVLVTIRRHMAHHMVLRDRAELVEDPRSDRDHECGVKALARLAAELEGQVPPWLIPSDFGPPINGSRFDKRDVLAEGRTDSETATTPAASGDE
jgi:hypothetical protein